MNAPEHAAAQPGLHDYENGDTSSWAEDVSPSTWREEYDGDQTARNEIGMPEMRTASQLLAHAERKATLAEFLARKTLGRQASAQAIEDQAFNFMHLPTSHLIEAYSRVAETSDPSELPSQDQQSVQAQLDGLQAQAQQCMAEGKWAEAQQCLAEMMQMQAQQSQQQAQPQTTQAQGQGQPMVQAQQQAPAQQQQVTQAQQQSQGQQQAPVQAQGQQQQVQASITMTPDQLRAFVASEVRKAQQGQGQGQQGQQAQQQMAQAQQQQVQQQQAVQAEDAFLDDLLADPPAADPMMDPGMDMGWDGLELSAPPMGVEDVPSDPDLEALFNANDESQAALALQNPMAQQGQGQGQHQQSQGQVHQASTRTASVMGTRPPVGVTRINSAPPRSVKAGSSVADLSALWSAPPDVSKAFRLSEDTAPRNGAVSGEPT